MSATAESGSVGLDVAKIAFSHPGRRRWWLALAASLGLVGVLAGCVLWLLVDGVGVWGNNVPVTWAIDIVAYDWWIGVATGALTVSATLLLTGADWRGGVSRITETIALLAAVAAGLYPIIHLGRPWFFYWNLPYPNTFWLWPQMRSPLYWDAIDIVSYLGVCMSFGYVGMIPDLAGLRDRAIERIEQLSSQPGGWTRVLKAQVYGIAALGWRGSVVHWQRAEQAYRAIAVFGLVVVVSLQTGAAVMFAGTAEPGWHDTLLPVAFVCAAVFAGVAVVAVALVMLRFALPVENLITTRHLERIGMLLLLFGLANFYCNATETLTTALTGSAYDQAALVRRFVGSHAWATWALILCALLPVHLLWFGGMRRSPKILLVIGLLVAFGIWADHFMVIVGTLQQDFLPSSVHEYRIGAVGVATFFGTVGLFLFLLLLFVRYLPVVSIIAIRRTGSAVPHG